MHEGLRRVMARLVPWYDPAQVRREAARTEQIRRQSFFARKAAMREQYRAAEARLARMSGR